MRFVNCGHRIIDADKIISVGLLHKKVEGNIVDFEFFVNVIGKETPISFSHEDIKFLEADREQLIKELKELCSIKESDEEVKV